MSTDDQATFELLAVASKVLKGHGFDVKTEPLAGSNTSWVLAENELFVIAVVAASDIDGIRTLEAAAVPELVERVTSSQASGGKRWDAYVVLVSSSAPSDSETIRDLRALEFNTRGVRRLTAMATQPTVDHLSKVLRPFVPIQRAQADMLSNAHQQLEAQLVLHGVSEEDAARAVQTYSETGKLIDV